MPSGSVPACPSCANRVRRTRRSTAGKQQISAAQRTSVIASIGVHGGVLLPSPAHAIVAPFPRRDLLPQGATSHVPSGSWSCKNARSKGSRLSMVVWAGDLMDFAPVRPLTVLRSPENGRGSKQSCTTSKERRITRWEHEHILEAVQRSSRNLLGRRWHGSLQDAIGNYHAWPVGD